MSLRRRIWLIGVLLFTAPIAVAAQHVSRAHSDLQGYWNIATRTPLERPAEFENRTHFTAQEAAEFERTFFERARQRLPADARELQIDLNDTWLEDARVDRLRTALILDPPNGRLPRLLAAGKARIAARPATSFDGPEAMPLIERCDTHNLDSGERLHVIERFERTDAETITYRVTAEDPDTWATPWTAEILFKATTNKLFEYACHEANYSMEHSLRGARAQEQRPIK